MNKTEPWNLPHMEDQPNYMATWAEPVAEDESGPLYRLTRAEWAAVLLPMGVAAAGWLALLIWGLS
jgi:negative regulator of sigma E activity